MLANWISAGVLLAGTAAFAQTPQVPGSPDTSSSQPGTTLHFTKKANTPPAPPVDTFSDFEKSALGSFPQRMSGSMPQDRMNLSSMGAQSGIRPARFQTPPPMVGGGGSDETNQPNIQLEPPGPLRLFRLETEAAFHERLRQEARERPTTEPPVEFPVEPVVTGGGPLQRAFPPMNEFAEPNYLCHGKLFFDQKNEERYGWDLGFIQPMVSAGEFYFDLLTLPYHIWSEPCRYYECSAGYCLPGDPVPYLLYPPNFSVTGLTAEAATAIALLAIFP